MEEKEPKVKKIKKKEGIDFIKKTKATKGVGRKKLEDKGLSTEMMDFAYLVGNGMDTLIAGRQVGLSDYQINAYKELPKVKAKIEEVKRMNKLGAMRSWVEFDDELRTAAVQTATEFITRARDSKTAPKAEELRFVEFCIKEWEKKRVAEGIDSKPIRTTATKRITTTDQQQIEGGDVKENKKEVVEEQELTFEEVDDNHVDTEELGEDSFYDEEGEEE